MLQQIPRQIVFELLSADSGVTGFIEDRLTKAVEIGEVESRDRRFIQSLTYGVIRNLSLLDWIIDRECTRKPPSGPVRVLLRIGVYQLLFMDRVAEHAAIHETVETAKRAGYERQSGFINGLLRNVLRRQDDISQTLKELESVSPWIRHSHPEWLYRKIEENYGAEVANQWMIWNNEPAEIYLTPNTRLTDTVSLSRALEMEASYVQVVGVPLLKERKILKWISGTPPQTTQCFREGQFYIQDPSTHMAAQWTHARKGDAVLDLCAAPGGKTQLLAQYLHESVTIDATDHETWRLELLKTNMDRMRLMDRVNVLESGIPDGKKYDWILIDAPCSNTGVIRRRVELRWRINEAECSDLQKVQNALLTRAASLLKPGGKIVYSTCSLDPEENGKAIRTFQEKHPDFQILQQLKLTPWDDQVDGAFAACLAGPK